MATPMADPSNALESFQQALAQGIIKPQAGDVHNDILFLFDIINDQKRFTYALKVNDSIVAIAAFVIAALDHLGEDRGWSRDVASGAQIQFFRESVADVLGAERDEVERFQGEPQLLCFWEELVDPPATQ